MFIYQIFQRVPMLLNLQKDKGKNNLQSLFGAYSNPSDDQIRQLLDAVSPNKRYRNRP
jgi:hypothetical protein